MPAEVGMLRLDGTPARAHKTQSFQRLHLHVCSNGTWFCRSGNYAPVDLMAFGHDEAFDALRDYLQEEFHGLRKEVAAVLDQLQKAEAHPQSELFGTHSLTGTPMSKNMFKAAVSDRVRKLSAMASEVTPIVRRRRLSLPTSWSGTSSQEVHELPLAQLKPPQRETSIDGVETASEGVEEFILPADVPGTVPEIPAPPKKIVLVDAEPETDQIHEANATSGPTFDSEGIPRTLSKKDLKWAQGLEREDAKLNLFERKTETVDVVGRGMGLVAGAEDFQAKVFRSEFHRRCYAIATSSSFEILTILLICSSALQIGFSTNDMADRLATETTFVHRVLEVSFDSQKSK